MNMDIKYSIQSLKTALAHVFKFQSNKEIPSDDLMDSRTKFSYHNKSIPLYSAHYNVHSSFLDKYIHNSFLYFLWYLAYFTHSRFSLFHLKYTWPILRLKIYFVELTALSVTLFRSLNNMKWIHSCY